MHYCQLQVILYMLFYQWLWVFFGIKPRGYRKTEKNRRWRAGIAQRPFNRDPQQRYEKAVYHLHRNGACINNV